MGCVHVAPPPPPLPAEQVPGAGKQWRGSVVLCFAGAGSGVEAKPLLGKLPHYQLEVHESCQCGTCAEEICPSCQRVSTQDSNG